ALAFTVAVVKNNAGQQLAIQPTEAEPQLGTRPDPELPRHERVQQERVGLPVEPAAQAEHEREPIAVLADCIDREESEASASEYRQRALAGADHLAVVYARWADLAGGADHERYQQLVNDALPQQYQEDDFGPEATWLGRTRRAAEMAGLDTREVVRATVGARTLADARSVAAVLDARMRKIVNPLVPLPCKPWTDRPRQFEDPQMAEY